MPDVTIRDIAGPEGKFTPSIMTVNAAIILGCGASIRNYPWTRLPSSVVKVGTNRSWAWTWSDRHVVADSEHWEREPGVYREMEKGGRLWSVGPFPVGACFPLGPERTWGSPTGGIATGIGSTGSVVFMALQLVAALIPSVPIYVVGLDLDGLGFDGHVNPHLAAQVPLFALAKERLEAAGREVYVIGPSKAPFKKAEWKW